jgi:hypothetical protein
MLAEIIEQGRELAANGGIGQAAGLKMLTPGDDMCARHRTEFSMPAQASEGAESADSDPAGLAGFWDW